jgi:hypothetical protein
MKLYQHDGKTYKRLRVGQIIKPTDFCNAKTNPVDSGWQPFGRPSRAEKTDILFFYREVPNV